MRLEEIPFPSCSQEVLQGWRALVSEASEPSVFLTPEWLGAWWRAYGDELTPLLTVGRNRAGEISGLAPLYAWRRKLAGRPGPQIICFMGDRSVGSEYLGLLVRGGEEEEFLSSLAERLGQRWALLDLNGLREGGELSQLLPLVFGQLAPSRIHRERHPCSAMQLPGSYDEYLASLPRKFRTKLRQRTNKLVKNHEVRLVRTTQPDELPLHLERLFEMHQARWVAEGLLGCFDDSRMRSFYRDVSEAFLERGWLRFYHLEVDGQIRATQFGFAFGGTFHSLQESFDHSFRPPGVGGLGVVLRGMIIQECIAEDLKVYDFLGGVEPFKTRWGTTTHYIQRLRIGAPGVVGALSFASTAGVRMVKDWGRANLPPALLDVRRRWRERAQARQARRLATNAGEE